MAGPNTTDSNKQNVKSYDLNIAGDFSANGLDIEPNETIVDREELRSSGNGDIQFEDEVSANHRRANRYSDEPMKSAAGPSTSDQEAGKKIVNPIPEWPADE